VPLAARRTFLGYRRPAGRAGTRNTIAVIGTVNCSAHTVRRIAERARNELLPRFPNVTDVVAIAHKSGCATRAGSPELELLQRTLAGFARHPNVAGALFVGLGCEVNQWETLLETQRERLGGLPPYIGIQDGGGVAKTVEAGVRALEQLLPYADQFRREPLPVSELCLALQCGGSDGFSGITGNPALGHAVDLLVAQGGTAVLSETPEVYGAEHLLTRRALSRTVGEKLVRQIRWWEEYTAREGFAIDNNPAPGRGSCFGFEPAPSIKIATNSTTYRRMPDDMDVNAGRILEGATVEEVGREIFEKLIAVASGNPSCSEAQGIGEEEFNPWILGATM